MAAATMSPAAIRACGAGKAYQSVAQSTAITVQDATDMLRSLSAIATTAAGVAMAQYVATQEQRYLAVLQETQVLIASATANFTNIGAAAAAVLAGFPAS